MSIIVRPVNLRHTLTLKYNIISVYRNILEHADLPYTFDLINKPWWRFHGELYGFSYSRVHRSYDLWVSNGLKRNIRLYMPLLMKMPPERINTTSFWINRSFLYTNTMKNNLYLNFNFHKRYFKKTNLTFSNIYTSSKEAVYYNFPGNREHFAINPSGIYSQGDESVFSAFNGKWHSASDHYSGFHKLKGLRPTNNFMGINDNYISTSFFINLYDTTVILYPQNYLNYYNKIFKKRISDIISPYFLKMVNSWIFNYNDSYNNILSNFYSVLYKTFLNKIDDYFFHYFNLSGLNLLKYKLNLFYLIYFKNLYDINYYNFLSLKKNNYVSMYICFYGFSNFNNFSILNISNSYKLDNKLNYGYYLNNKFIKNYRFFNIYNYKNKIKKFYLLNHPRFRLKKRYLSFINKNKQSLGFINYYRSSWTLKFLISLKKKYLKKYFIKKYFNIFSNKKIFYIYKFKNLSRFSKLYLKKKYNLDIKRILNYGKLFLRAPSFLMKRRCGYTKLSSLIASNTLFRTFLFPYFNKITYTKIENFISNAFIILNCLIKINFGFSYGLLNDNNLNIDNNYYLNIQYYLSRFFIFFHGFLRKKRNNLFKRNFFFYKLLFNILKYKLARKNINYIKRIFFNKLKYLNYCYKGLSFKLFRKIRKDKKFI